MNSRLETLYRTVTEKGHLRHRARLDMRWGEEFAREGLTPLERATRRIERLLRMEAAHPCVLPGERIVYTRTVDNSRPRGVMSSDIRETSCPIFSDAEWEKILSEHFVHFTGDVNNVCPDYTKLLSSGTSGMRGRIADRMRAFGADGERVEYLQALLRVLDGVELLADSYRDAAARAGSLEAARVLEQVPRYPARTFHEALQFLRILNFTLYLSANHHSSLGRLDQYLYPYYRRGLDSGELDREGARELLTEFFLGLNKDTDLYYGMQLGDNGQSVTLGGLNEDGTESYNELSELCLEVSLELRLIDPKINLRVHGGTPQSVLELGSELTRQGLGFPQYANDDLVIPALIRKGYAPEDAYRYAIAACWEFIIPGGGMDITDIEGISLPGVLDGCLHADLDRIRDYDGLMSSMRRGIERDFQRVLRTIHSLFVIPGPFLSMLMDGCVEEAKDISTGNRYNNFGVVASGISTAVDSIAAIRTVVFEKKLRTLKELVEAVDRNFEGEEELYALVRYDAPKFGNDDDRVDAIAVELLDQFADALESAVNERGGRFRPGTGTAMYYVFHPKEIGASPDGRLRGEPFSANYSPSLNARLRGPLSVLRSFAKPDLLRMMNGGPLTIELHDTSLRGPEGVQKIAQLVRFFIDIGGQQMQLNAVNREKLRDAMENPEAFGQLIVRVWGWSGYFVQLDEDYQRQIVKRYEFAL